MSHYGFSFLFRFSAPGVGVQIESGAAPAASPAAAPATPAAAPADEDVS